MRLVIFDVDGTLIDSQAFILAAMAAAFAEAGLPAPGDAATLSIVGLSLPQAIARLAPALTAEEVGVLVALYKANFVRLRAETGGEAAAPLYPGARAALDRLSARGVALAVATGKARAGLDHALRAHGMTALFAATQTADDAPSKPHPGMVLNILSATGADPRRTVMVGDTTFDVEMARAAGVAAVGVGWGYHPAGALRAAGAATVLDRFDALDAALDALGAAA
jgi:phosphoglycolate phosphatase